MSSMYFLMPITYPSLYVTVVTVNFVTLFMLNYNQHIILYVVLTVTREVHAISQL